MQVTLEIPDEILAMIWMNDWAEKCELTMTELITQKIHDDARHFQRSFPASMSQVASIVDRFRTSKSYA